MKKIITPEIYDFAKSKLKNSKHTSNDFRKACSDIESKFGVSINFRTLKQSYMIKENKWDVKPRVNPDVEKRKKERLLRLERKCEILKDEISKSPGNLKDAFANASRKLNEESIKCTPSSLSTLWYNKLCKEEKVYELKSNHVTLENSKNIPSEYDDLDERDNFNSKLLSTLFESAKTTEEKLELFKALKQ